jgi:hypothetical protein
MSPVTHAAAEPRRRSHIGHGLAVALVAALLAVPAAALGNPVPPDLPRGINGSTNDAGGRPSPPPASPTPKADEGFSWGDAGIGAGVVAGLVVAAGMGLAISRRRQTAAAPAVGREGSDFSRMAPLERDIDATNS